MKFDIKVFETIPRYRKGFRINENNEYVPRFSLKNINGVGNITINKRMKPTKNLMITAIKYGLIFAVRYRGAYDKKYHGHNRVIYPMVLGKSSKGDILLRGYHLTGWSVSGKGTIDKEWRMFRLDRFREIIFTGSFYRLPPDKYNAQDKGMRGGIIAAADFSEIRRNQQDLISQNIIEPKEDSLIQGEGGSPTLVGVRVRATGTELDLNDVFSNPILDTVKDDALLKISFLKSEFGNSYIAILGSAGKAGNRAKLITDKGNVLGIYKVIDSMSGEQLKRIKKVKEGKSKFLLFEFVKKV
jgi:hypothetical protein